MVVNAEAAVAIVGNVRFVPPEPGGVDANGMLDACVTDVCVCVCVDANGMVGMMCARENGGARVLNGDA